MSYAHAVVAHFGELTAVFYVITYRAKLLNADWLRERESFHDHLMLIEPFSCFWQPIIDCNLTELNLLTLSSVL